MPTNKEKLNTLNSLIIEDATKSRDAILEQLRRDSEQKLAEQKADIDRQAENEFAREESRAVQEREATVSRARIGAKKMLMSARNDIISSVLKDLKSRLAAFTKSDAYRAFLMTNIKETLERVGVRDGTKNSGILVFLTPIDCDKYAKDAEPILAGAKILPGNPDMIGGCRVENAHIGIYADNTLDKKADMCIDELFQISGMSIGNL